MATSRVYQVDGIGPVLFEKSRKAKRVNISVRDAGTVRVAVPMRTSINNAAAFVLQSREWILHQKARLAKAETKNQRLRDRLAVLDKKEASAALKSRLAHLAEHYGFSYEKVSVRNQKTRWGSCSARNNISLNIRLAVLPDELRDYVLLHELVHTRHHNHSREFWRELDKYTGDAKVLAKRLHSYNLRLL